MANALQSNCTFLWKICIFIYYCHSIYFKSAELNDWRTDWNWFDWLTYWLTEWLADLLKLIWLTDWLTDFYLLINWWIGCSQTCAPRYAETPPNNDGTLQYQWIVGRCFEVSRGLSDVKTVINPCRDSMCFIMFDFQILYMVTLLICFFHDHSLHRSGALCGYWVGAE